MAAVIAYHDAADGIGPAQLEGFFVDWPEAPSPARHLELLRGSDHVVLAVDEEADRVVGFVTAISDGVLSAYVPLLEVLPEYRSRGIGSELMRRLLMRLEQLYMVDLCCDADLVPFYERLGLRRWDAGMGLRGGGGGPPTPTKTTKPPT
jgi:ribosomal protein S18 acetylase RimI-like enzyme